MMRCFISILWMSLSLFADDTVSISLRGKAQLLARIQPEKGVARGSVIFLPGDGGWRGAAVGIARMIASMGYEVFGFDTKKYLETFSQNGLKLSQEQLAEDIRALAGNFYLNSPKPVILAGWSQGAGMAVAAVSGKSARGPIHGIITIGLPESAVLGWDWKATLAIIARREPDQPNFRVKPLLGRISPTPIWMIHGAEDEYTSYEVEQALFQAASEPKRFEEIAGANHRFDEHQAELYRSLKAGLEWIAAK